MKNIALSLFAIFLLPVALAGAEGTLIGATPYASWEEGSSDYFVLFNSLIDDQITLYGETTNRQADTCILESSFTLNTIHTPDDAIVAQAYLVWMGAVDPEKFTEPTDNAVHLKFSRDDGYEYEEDIVAGDEPKMLGDTTDPFLFQSVQFNTEVTTGCTESDPGIAGAADVAYFTYRTDITSFFQKIADDNRTAVIPVLKGEAFYGTYTFSGLDCTDHDNYKCRTTMVSNWSMIVVYKSEKVSNKKLYLYPGFAYMQDEVATANVSGFYLPKDPLLRLTAMTAEGDPALANPNLQPERIYIKGENATSYYDLSNDCNPLDAMAYEIYNSNSSLYGWDPDNEQLSCLTGGINGQYFGIDADTFLLDSRDDVNLQEHLNLGATNLDVTLSVNQDAILSNYLILAVDNKAGAFDIPEEASVWPYGREKHFCSCRRDEDSLDALCGGRPYYYLIKVQNWGQNIVTNVTVIDNLHFALDYIPGTTEMATQFDENGNGTDWTSIPDKAGTGNDAFPLSGDGYKVADTMDICDRKTWTCADSRLIRFKVMPPDSLKGYGPIPNLAYIKEAGSTWEYETNSGFALNLYQGVCKELAVCPEPSKEECGGGCTYDCGPECDENRPCPEFEVCDLTTYTCKPDPAFLCTDAKVSYDLGFNSPDNEATTIVPAVTEDLVVGQFKINAENCIPTKDFYFVSLRVRTVKDDVFIKLSNIELVYDRDGSGSIESDDEVVATVANPDSTGAYFVIDKMKNRFAGNEDHYFLIRADVAYGTDEVPGGATFHFAIENENSFQFSDAGTSLADGGSIDFAEFMLEPSKLFFIVTKGENDPGVPPAPNIKADIALLQLRAKAIDAVNVIKLLTVSVPTSPNEEYITFGNEIRSLSLYADTNGDGVPDGEPLAKVTKFNDAAKASFEGKKMEAYLTFNAGEEKFLIINGDLSELKKGEKARIEIEESAITLMDGTRSVLGLPVLSKEFYYEDCFLPGCEDRDDVCPPPGCCSCSLAF